jgi:hypothetical protein
MTGQEINILAGVQQENLIPGSLTVTGAVDVGSLSINGAPFSVDLTSTQIAVGSVANGISSNAQLTYAPLTGAFKVNDTLSVDVTGDVVIKGAAVNAGQSGNGGNVRLIGGLSGDVDSFDTGGNIYLTAGGGTSGGVIEIYGGSGDDDAENSTAGSISLVGGQGANGVSGGTVNLRGGDAAFPGEPGDVTLSPGVNGVVYGNTYISGTKIIVSGNLKIYGNGKGISVFEGSNCKQGVVTLVAGTRVVSNTSVTATSRIFLTTQDPNGGTPGFLIVSARTASTSFTILSSDVADTSIVAYEIFEVTT